MSETEFDVVILGAGVAGLAAARDLSRAGLRVRVLEARNRIGGRIFTVHDPLSTVPVELGAEFVHGSPAETFALIHDSGLTAYDVVDSHFLRTDHASRPGHGGLKEEEDFWGLLGELLQKLRTSGPDRSFREFLEQEDTGLRPDQERLVLSFIEGFHASDADRVSEKALAHNEQASNAAASAGLFRLTQGYDSIPQALYQGIRHPHEVVQLGRIVRDVVWQKGQVEVRAESPDGRELEPLHARRALITLPLGVLQASPSEGGVQFLPPLEAKRSALSALAMGPVLKLVMMFRDEFWQTMVHEPIGFLHAPSEDFQVWWTTRPLHSPCLIAWVGGGAARPLLHLERSDWIEKSLESLAKALEWPIARLHDQLQTVHVHDWQKDPFARGAYSFVLKGGYEASLRLQEPLEGTLFFAGEATHSGEQRGTVDGAIATGLRAAREILLRMHNRPTAAHRTAPLFDRPQPSTGS